MMGFHRHFWVPPIAGWFISWKISVCCFFWLVVSTHLEKYEFVNGKNYPIYEMDKYKMFQTTNQFLNGLLMYECLFSLEHDRVSMTNG